MPLKTDLLQTAQESPRSEFGRGFLPLLVSATLFALFAVLWANKEVTPRSQYTFDASDYRGATVAPWILAWGKSIENGSAAFRGRTPDYPSPSLRSMVLLSLIIVFVVCPTVYLFRWRERRLNSRRLRDEPLRASDLIYGFCALVTLFAAIGIVPLTIRQEIVRYSGRNAQAIQTNRDHLFGSISEIVVQLEQYRILPKSLAGGGGNLNGYSLSQELSRTQYRILTVTTAGDSATITARSSLYPSSSIRVEFKYIDMSRPLNALRNWTYEGAFK